MIKSSLLSYALKHSYTVKGGKAYKLIDGYYVTLSEEYGYKRIVISITGDVNPISKRSIETFVNSNIIKYRLSKFRWNDNNIEICFQTNGGKATVRRMDEFLTDLLFKLKNSDINGANLCFYCHQSNNEDSYLYSLDGIAVKAHGNCMVEYNKVEGINTHKHYGNGKLLSGLVGSLYGAVIGSILLLLSVFVDYPIFILSILTGILSRFYYDVCDGYKSYFVKLICVTASSLLMIWVAYYIPALVFKDNFEVTTSLLLAMITGFFGCFINLKTKGRDRYPTDRLYRLK